MTHGFTMKFVGSFEDLKARLHQVEGKWSEPSALQKQFHHVSGGIMNWYPSKGKMTFQGSEEESKALEETVRGILTPQTAPSSGKAEEPGSQVGAEEVSSSRPKPSFRSGFSDSELIIGLVGAVGAELSKVVDVVQQRLQNMGYTVDQIRISSQVIPALTTPGPPPQNEFERIDSMMTAGDEARKSSGDNSILALGAAAEIASKRGSPEHLRRRAHIINSLKHPDEVVRLREIYPQGFYLLGVHSDNDRRFRYLTVDRQMTEEQARRLIARDQDEQLPFGQRVTDTFHMSDFFVRLEGDDDKLKNGLWRLLDLLFGNPFITPTFQEYAMFLAFAASLRSADLSRQVGAVIAEGREIIATGANDCPKPGGGLYWSEFVPATKKIEDEARGRDYTRGEDANKAEQSQIIEEILKLPTLNETEKTKLREALESSRIRDLTEFGRPVHAEMEALLSCARNGLSAKGGVLFCTTFPCHNCAKHIVAAGLKRVVYIEPYPKSKAADLHDDSIVLGISSDEEKDPEDKRVRFEAFVGVGPRRFFDLFSMKLGSGYPLKRRKEDGTAVEWHLQDARLRIQMLPFSYLDFEVKASESFNALRKK